MPLRVPLYFLYFVLPDFGITMPAFLNGTAAVRVQYSAYTSKPTAPAWKRCPRVRGRHPAL